MCGPGIEASYHLGDAVSCVSGYGVMGMSGGPASGRPGHRLEGHRRVVKAACGPTTPGAAAFSDESAGYGDSTLSFRCCLDDNATAAPAGDADPGDGSEADGAKGDAAE